MPSNVNASVPEDPQQTYVNNSSEVVQPYFEIAKNYGFANYMFQTSQGPSFPAHQFLFGGTSAPDFYMDTLNTCGGVYPCYEWFAAENATTNGTFGCTASAGADILEVNPAGVESSGIYKSGYPCYNHSTLADLLDQNDISWRYYPQGPDAATSLWTAPNAIYNICKPSDGACTGTDWVNNVKPEIPPSPPVSGEMAPILSDIQTAISRQ
jgi:phospholipase C